ncbi:MAG: cupin domain-containing protein [Ignavibacteriaceae bacterium]|nr:cupin domain-containing protein [Ignavibacteriaceae bacterium]
MHPKAQKYIKQLQLKKHPEGGYFREVYRSGERILPTQLPKRYKSSRNFSTSIYFLLEGKQFSAFHLLQSDEIWHFYDGSSVLLYIINQKGEISNKKLGKKKGCDLQIAIEKQNWFAAELEDKKSFALFGCTVSPGFEFEDFELGKRNHLIKKFPQHSAVIKRLTKSS